MKKALCFTIAAAFLFSVLALPAVAQTLDEKKVRTELETVRQRLEAIESFQKDFYSRSRKEIESNKNLMSEFIQFSERIFDLSYQLMVTEAIFGEISGRKTNNPFLMNKIIAIYRAGMTLDQFVTKMLPVLKDGIKALEAQKKVLVKSC